MFRLLNGVIVGPKIGNFLGVFTWATRPTAANVGDEAYFSDLNYSKMVWNGTRFVSAAPQVVYINNGAAAAHTGTLTKTAIRSFTLPGALLGANGMLDVDFTATTNNSANAKLWNITLGGTNLFHVGPSSTTQTGGRARIVNRNSQSAQLGTPLNLTSTWATGVNTQLTATADTSVDLTVTISATLADVADTMTLQGVTAFFTSIA